MSKQQQQRTPFWQKAAVAVAAVVAWKNKDELEARYAGHKAAAEVRKAEQARLDYIASVEAANRAEDIAAGQESLRKKAEEAERRRLLAEDLARRKKENEERKQAEYEAARRAEVAERTKQEERAADRASRRGRQYA